MQENELISELDCDNSEPYILSEKIKLLKFWIIWLIMQLNIIYKR
jgi:hypothetical protein